MCHPYKENATTFSKIQKKASDDIQPIKKTTEEQGDIDY